MFGKDLLIKKYPYLAFSSNIMEYFAIIGYQERFVPQMLDSYRKKKNPDPPTILSSITSNTDFGFVDNNLIIGQVYPENPCTILINKNDINQEVPSTSNIIYSFCFDSTDGKSKLFYVCYAFKFYEKYIYNISNDINEEYYVPKAFCIISQYYYFTLFEYICKNLYVIMTQKGGNTLPVEFTIYNIVNFIPSPINYGLHLDLFSHSLNVPDIEIGQLSGYPYLDFDLSEIFNLLPLNLILEIYILTIIEPSMLFFSSNLEILNMVMFIMYVLNYPCNDSTYFWHIVSVSKDNFVEENQFVGKLMVSLLGVNTTYDENIDTSVFSKYHFIVDIDNKRVFFNQALDLSEDNDIQEYGNLNDLDVYIQNIIREKDKIQENSFLKPSILRLKKNLDFILTKNPGNIDYTPNPKNKYVNFFKMSPSIMENNKKIQEIFYDFSLNILMIFFQDNCLNSSFDKIKRDEPDESIRKLNKLRGSGEDTKFTKEDNLFLYFFRNSIKYKIYFENFIQNMESLEVFKIPLLFSEEFINIKLYDTNNKIMNKISLFSIIDSLYCPNKDEIINISLKNIFNEYLEKLKKFFKHFYSQENKKMANKKQLIVLNKKILEKYIYLLTNYYEKEDLNNIFPSIRIQEKESILSIDRRYIINVIQNTLEQKNIIEIPNYLIYALVYIFSISLTLHSYQKTLTYLNKIIKTLSKLKIFLRQNIYIIIKTFYKYYIIHKQKKLYPDLGVSSIKMYFYMLINVLKDNYILPNEEMMKILNHFFSKIIYQERDSLAKKKEREIDYEADFKIEKNQNFLCFMKYCFTGKKMFKPNIMIKAAIKECNNSNIVIKCKKKQIQPTVNIKIKEYFYSSVFFSPKKIYKIAQSTYNNFFDKEELEMSKLNVKNVRDVIVNLIQYGLELNTNEEIIPIDFLVYTLYLFRNHEENFRANKNIKKEKI